MRYGYVVILSVINTNDSEHCIKTYRVYIRPLLLEDQWVLQIHSLDVAFPYEKLLDLVEIYQQ